MAAAACEVGRRLGAVALCCFTRTGDTARRLARQRSPCIGQLAGGVVEVAVVLDDDLRALALLREDLTVFYVKGNYPGSHCVYLNKVIAEVAGELLLRANTALVIGDPERSGGSSPAEWRELVDVYNTGSPRHRRVFTSINLQRHVRSRE